MIWYHIISYQHFITTSGSYHIISTNIMCTVINHDELQCCIISNHTIWWHISTVSSCCAHL